MPDHPKDIIRRPLAERRVHVPEWEQEVMVRALTGAERSKVETAAAKARKEELDEDAIGARVMATAIVVSVRDTSGQLLFGAEDVAALEAGPASVLHDLFEAINALSRLTRPAIAVKKNN